MESCKPNDEQLIQSPTPLTPAKNPALKAPSQFRLIGKDGLQRKDISGKTDGRRGLDEERQGKNRKGNVCS